MAELMKYGSQFERRARVRVLPDSDTIEEMMLKFNPNPDDSDTFYQDIYNKSSKPYRLQKIIDVSEGISFYDSEVFD